MNGKKEMRCKFWILKQSERSTETNINVTERMVSSIIAEVIRVCSWASTFRFYR